MYKLLYCWQSYAVKAGYESDRPFCLPQLFLHSMPLPLAKARGFFFGFFMIGYGLVSAAQVKHFSTAVCDVLGGGEAAVRLLFETAAAETLCGTVPDRTRHGAGRGLYQCDEIAFRDVVARAKQSDIDALEKTFDFDLRRIEWSSLNYSPVVAAAVCRLHYKLRPEALPLTLSGRAAYWKKYYNTVAGKGSAADYLHRVSMCERYY